MYGVPSAAGMDARDGVIDGTYYGSPIVQSSLPIQYQQPGAYLPPVQGYPYSGTMSASQLGLSPLPVPYSSQRYVPPPQPALTPVQYPSTQHSSIYPTDPLDAYHQNLLGYSSMPLEFKYTGPPAKIPKITPGFGWFANTLTTFRYVPNDRTIYDQRGIPVLRVTHLTSGYLLYGMDGQLMAKSDGYKNVWNLEAPSGRLTLRTDGSYEVHLESNIKNVPFATSSTILLKANWGALLPPVEECFVVLNNTGEDIALIRNQSGGSVHQGYSITIKPEHDALILLVLLCHIADFVLQHCATIDKTTRGNLDKDKKSLQRLYKSLDKWGAEPPPAAICTPPYTMGGAAYSVSSPATTPYTGEPFVPKSFGYISQPDRY